MFPELGRLKNAHKGDRCFLIGSGPSIKGMDLSWLKDEITICVNESYKALPFEPTYICIGDKALWPLIKKTYAGMTKTKLFCTTGTTGTCGEDYEGKNMVGRVRLDRHRSVFQDGFTYDLSDSVAKGWNVMPEVVFPFVCWCGFDEAYLIGCDCNDEGYFYEKALRGSVEEYQHVVPKAHLSFRAVAQTKNLPTKIFNATVGGDLAHFPRRLFSSLHPFLVVGFYTTNGDYREMAEAMKASVEAQGLRCIIVPRASWAKPHMEPPMPWVLNCSQCSFFVEEMRQQYPKDDLFYLDADAVMVRHPKWFFDNPRDYDFAAPIHKWPVNQRILSSNSLYFSTSERATELIRMWRLIQEKRNKAMLKGYFLPSFKEVWDQKVLQDAVPLVPGLRWAELPWEYAKTTPTPKGDELMPNVNPAKVVINQFQASRWNKHLPAE